MGRSKSKDTIDVADDDTNDTVDCGANDDAVDTVKIDQGDITINCDNGDVVTTVTPSASDIESATTEENSDN